jgi:hypothetical protein
VKAVLQIHYRLPSPSRTTESSLAAAFRFSISSSVRGQSAFEQPRKGPVGQEFSSGLAAGAIVRLVFGVRDAAEQLCCKLGKVSGSAHELTFLDETP